MNQGPQDDSITSQAAEVVTNGGVRAGVEESDDPVLVERLQQKFIVTMNRPEAMNAMNIPLLNQLGEAIREFDEDPDSLVAIIKAADGTAFSTGADLKSTSERDSSGAPGYYPTDGLPRGFRELERCNKPVVAAIGGYCLAGGLELSLLCDIRVAARNAVFGLPEVRWSLLPNGGLHDLPRMIPRGEAAMLQLTGRWMSADRAFSIGLVQQLEEDWSAAVVAAYAIADEIILGAPMAVRASKQIARLSGTTTVERARRLAAPIAESVEKCPDRLEGVRAFVEKRQPRWEGRS